jgi:hypothetical protein
MINELSHNPLYPHSHSTILSHGNMPIWQRKFFRAS